MGVRLCTGVASHAGGVDEDGTGEDVAAVTGGRAGEVVGVGPDLLAEAVSGSSGIGIRAVEVGSGIEAGTAAGQIGGRRRRGDRDAEATAGRPGTRTCRGLATTTEAGSCELAGGDWGVGVTVARNGNESSSNTT